MARESNGQVVEYAGKRGRTYALRFRAYGHRRHVSLGRVTRDHAEMELQNVLADVRRGIWRPFEPEPEVEVKRDPTFHEFSSEWFEARRRELRPNTRLDYEWQLTHHLLPFFAKHRLSQITVAEVDRYRQAKVREARLSATSINKTITRLAQILEVAEEYGHVERNTARGKRRRLKATKANRAWLDRAEQIAALLDAAGELDTAARADRRGIGRRAMIATMLFGGLRVGELCALRWREVDLAAGRLRVGESKTDAGVRYVDLLPALRDELLAYKASARRAAPGDYVFSTTRGGPRDRHNVRERIVKPAVVRASERLEAAGSPPLPLLTPHSLRHTCASLRFAVGDEAPYVMAQLGHTDPKVTLGIYAHVMFRRDGERERLRALVEGADWAEVGRSSALAASAPLAAAG